MGVRESLSDYHRKRDFSRTPEPKAGVRRTPGASSFVVQKHQASHLHYDLRLELDGTLKSWAVPKGPCLDPSVKRMAVRVEDHPLGYGAFEGTIPAGQYGAGSVIVWDRGSWHPEGDARAGLAAGKLKFRLQGNKLRGGWALVRMRDRGEKHEAWLLIKENDAAARSLAHYDVVEAEPDSVFGAHRPNRRSDAATSPAKPKRPRKPAAGTVLPASLAPQLAILAAGPPAAPDEWLYELKFDGYRLLTRIEDGVVRCFTRSGLDWTERLPQLVHALEQLPTQSAWLDGEIIVQDAHGVPDFQALQNAFDRRATDSIAYWLFDAPFLDGEDLRQLPIEQRRTRLAGLLTSDMPVQLQLSQSFDASPGDLLASTAKMGFEGIVGKRRGSLYVSGRSPDWVKLKNHRRQEFVIGGYTAPNGSRIGFGALLLGLHDGAGQLRYCGKVGTGFDAHRLADLKARFDRLAVTRSPFAQGPASLQAHWVKPQLVAEVAFGEWTRAGRVRHAVFYGLRTDKPANEIIRERVEPAAASKQEAGAGSTRQNGKAKPGMKKANSVTHAERVIDQISGVTKGELVAYYAAASKAMLPHLKGRPVSLLRAPEGVGGELFFQKHGQGAQLPGVRLLDAALDPGHAPLLQIDTAEGLLSAAQMNAVEFHSWNALSSQIGEPDRIVFDLDPGEGVEWAQVRQAAVLVQALLAQLGLSAFLKTSGGKGLHVVVPIRPRLDWDAVKGFSQSLVVHLAATLPQRFVAKSGARNRIGKIFVDYLRNGFGATTVSAWSVRARPGLGVSVPVGWDELATLRSGDHWTLRNVSQRFSIGNRPWSQMGRQRRALTVAIRKLAAAGA